MKNFVLVFLMFFSLSHAVSLRETFLQANLCYEQGDYKKALSLYQKIEKKGHAIWYNMGNCHYQLDDNKMAVICYKKSLYGSSYVQCMNALESIDTIQGTQTSFLKKLYAAIVSRPTWYFQVIFLFFWLLLCGLFFRIGLMIRIPLMVVLVIVWIPLSMHILKKEYALSTQSTSLYMGPDDTFPALCNLDKGHEFRVQEHKKDWCKVKADGYKGWIKKEHIVLV